MKKQHRTYSTAQFFSVILMITALLWLTVSLPFVYNAQQASITWSAEEEQGDYPFSNTTEEKAPSSVSIAEEYLHDHSEIHAFIAAKLNHAHCHAWDVYIAFHGELISPPPDTFLS